MEDSLRAGDAVCHRREGCLSASSVLNTNAMMRKDDNDRSSRRSRKLLDVRARRLVKRQSEDASMRGCDPTRIYKGTLLITRDAFERSSSGSESDS